MKRNITFGLSLIVLAILIVLNALGYLGGLSTWTIILSFILLVIFLASLVKLEYFGIFISLGLGAIIYKDQLGFQDVSAWTIIIASLLLGIGFSAIFKKSRIHYYNFGYQDNEYKREKMREKREEMRNFKNSSSSFSRTDDGIFYGYTDNKSGEEDIDEKPIEDDVITYRSRFSNSTRFIKSKNLEKAFFDNEFGSLTIYLDQVDLSEDGAEIEVYCRFGNIRLFVPHYFYIDNQISNDLGSVSMPYNTAKDNGYNSIVLKGNVTLGDIKVVRI